MQIPTLSIQAASAEELCSKLSRIDITVPLVTEGRLAQHREQYTGARFLATFSDTELLTYPLDVQHTDKPDLTISTNGKQIGVECVEAVPEDWYEIEALRERHFPETLNFGQIYFPCRERFTKEEKWAIAKGEKMGSPWVGTMAERSWAAAMEHFIRLKLEKLRSGNYSGLDELWLLIQDEWRAPMHYESQLENAMNLIAGKLSELFEPPCFSRVFICRNQSIIQLQPQNWLATPVNNLWQQNVA
jgi:hypothetical protein